MRSIPLFDGAPQIWASDVVGTPSRAVPQPASAYDAGDDNHQIVQDMLYRLDLH